MHGRVVIVQVALDQLQRLDRDDREAGRGWRVVLGVGRGRHPGQPTAVGAHHGDGFGRQLDQDAAQGVAGALDVGREDRPPDQLLQIGGGHDMIARRGEVGDLREEVRVFHRQGELRVQAADHQPIVLGLDRQLRIPTGPEDRTDL